MDHDCRMNLDWSSDDDYISSLDGLREMSAWDPEHPLISICSLCRLRIPPRGSGWYGHNICSCVSPDEFEDDYEDNVTLVCERECCTDEKTGA